MFAEELSCNTGRKKAEENRARRKRIQQQQQQQQKNPKPPPQQQSIVDNNVSSSSTTTVVEDSIVLGQGTVTSTATITATSNTSSGLAKTDLEEQVEKNSEINNSNNDSIAIPKESSSAATTATTITSTTGSVIGTPLSVSNRTATTTTNDVSIVERAKIERMNRALKGKQVQCAIRIQTWIRQTLVSHKISEFYTKQLQDQLSDITKVKTILLKTKGQSTFVPPATTTTNLIRQILFITSSSSRQATTKLVSKNNRIVIPIIQQSTTISAVHLTCIQQIIELCILPSLSSSTSSTNNTIFDGWISEKSDSLSKNIGWYRLRNWIRLLLICVVHPQLKQPTQLDTILNCISCCINPKSTNTSTTTTNNNHHLSPSGIIIRSFIFPNIYNETTTTDSSASSSSSSSSWTAVFPGPCTGSSTLTTSTSQPLSLTTNTKQQLYDDYDWILTLRHYFLFYMQQPSRKNSTTGSTANSSNRNSSSSIDESIMYRPIPSDIDVKREESFPSNERYRANRLLQFILYQSSMLPSTSMRHYIQARIVSHILTIPVLLYRIKAVPDNKSNKTLTTTNNRTDAVSLLLETSNVGVPVQIPMFVQLIQSFIHVHGTILNNIRVTNADDMDLILPTDDVPMTLCPAKPSQCLLANLIQFGRMCSVLDPHGSSSKFSYTITAGFFDLLSMLIDCIPLSTYTTRESSAVEWIDDGRGHSTPIVLSNVILDQCKGILVDSYIRRLFYLATTDSTLKETIDSVLKTKSSTDKKHEKDMVEAGGSETSAASLAAKEARVDRNQSLWNTSKWAIQLTKNVSNLFSNVVPGKDTSLLPKDRKSSNTSNTETGESNHKQGKAGGSKAPSDAQRSTSEPFTTDLLLSLCRTYSIFLARWGGGGTHDIVNQKGSTSRNSTTADHSVATSRAESFTLLLLNVLCFSTPIVHILWGLIQKDESSIFSNINSIIDPDKVAIPVNAHQICPIFRADSTTSSNNRFGRSTRNNDGAVALYMFLSTLLHVLVITDDVEIHDMDRPLPLHQIRRCVLMLKKLLYRATCIDVQANDDDQDKAIKPNYFGYALVKVSSSVLKDLYDRSSRRPFCVPSMWTIPNLLEKEIGKCKTCKDYMNLLSKTPILKVCPYLVPFKRRLKLFERIITTNRIEIQGENSSNPFHSNPLKPGILVRITRGRLLEDGLQTMNNLGPNKLRQRLQVQYYNEAGLRETGIDAGGLFKDFWTDMCTIAFNPNYALFKVTETGVAGNCLYPNPSSRTVHGAEHIVLFEFLGRILGKALYEGITINPMFAHFFLSFLRGDYNFLHMLPDLGTVDPQLYNNLMFLKNYDGDCSDLALTFTVTTDEFGGTKEIPLIPNGANIDVTNDNKQRYIGLVAKYYVYDRVKEQSEAFTRGLWDVLDRSWLQLFNEPELQVLISGVAEGKLDIEDMKAHVQYAGGYSSIDRTVCRFWTVVATLSTKQQGQLLRFVTGCERPPPLGFGSMNPPFTIQRIGTGGGLLLRGDGNRLPEASTCFNVLKLPAYSSEKVLKERLIFAIESGAGFELS